VLLCLPVAVAAESLVGRPPAEARRFWLVVASLPAVLGTVLAGLALWFLQGGLAATPHLDRVRPHLCLQALTQLPDAPFRFHLYAYLAGALLLFGLVRLLVSLATSLRLARLAGGAAAGGETPVLTLDSPDADCFSLGLVQPLIVCTQGLRALLTAPELAAVLAHEAAHVRSRDALAELWLRFVTDAWLWLPSTHYYLRQARASRELTCDAWAAATHGRGVLTAALAKLAAVQQARHLRRRGDLARLRPVFPDHADPTTRTRALSGAPEPRVAPPLAVIGAIELAALAALVWWLHRPLHDTLYCLADSLLGVLGRG
jgi:Zn-dependent protease with chaperone function